jgi:Protein of unknown function (DUF3533)
MPATGPPDLVARIAHLREAYLIWPAPAATIAVGTLVVMSALGAPGQLLALLVFVYLGLASSGGTIPIQGLNGFFRFVANFEPLRQIVGAVRAILYFGAAGDAGLNRGLVLTAIGLALGIAVGLAVTTWYDKRGLDRFPRDTEPSRVGGGLGTASGGLAR